MTKDLNLNHKILSRTLAGTSSHVGTATIFDGANWKIAGLRPAGAPHSLFQLANHLIYWQEWAVKWLDGGNPRPPKHAHGSWPDPVSPATRTEWLQTVRRFRAALRALDQRSGIEDLLAKRGKTTRLEMLHIIAAHNSYHAGQVAFLRQLLAAWPPPSGGVTW